MILQIPKKLKIGGTMYNILVVESDDLESAAAQIDVIKGTIKVVKATPQTMQVSLLHEIIHAFNMEFPEERVEFLAQAFHALFVDNPKLFGGDSYGK